MYHMILHNGRLSINISRPWYSHRWFIAHQGVVNLKIGINFVGNLIVNWSSNRKIEVWLPHVLVEFLFAVTSFRCSNFYKSLHYFTFWHNSPSSPAFSWQFSLTISSSFTATFPIIRLSSQLCIRKAIVTRISESKLDRQLQPQHLPTGGTELFRFCSARNLL